MTASLLLAKDNAAGINSTLGDVLGSVTALFILVMITYWVVSARRKNR